MNLNLIGNPEIKNAEYVMTGLPEYDNNPLSAALPFLDRPEYGQAMNFLPDYDEAIRHALPKARGLACERVRRAFICTHRNLDFAMDFQCMTRSSFLGRNPRDETVKAWKDRLIDRLRILGAEGKISLKKCKISSMLGSLVRSETPSMSMIGPPASGKSGAVIRLLETVYKDRVIRHPDGNGGTFTQIPYLYQHCPIGVSAKQAIINLLEQLGLLTGEDFLSIAEKKTRNNIEDFVLPELINLLLLYNVGVIIIDEIEMIKAAYSRGDESLKNFWLLLMNCGIPLLLIGNPDALELFQDSFKLQHRLCGGGGMIFDKLPNDEGGEWQFFLEVLFGFQFTATKTELTQPIIDAMYRYSQGLIKITIRLWIWVQRLAINRGAERGNEIITPELIREAAERNAKLIAEMIDGLEHGLEENLLTEDLRMDVWRTFTTASGQKEQEGDAVTVTPAHSDPEAAAKPTRKRALRVGRVKPKRISDASKPNCKGEKTTADTLGVMGKLRSTSELQ